MLEWLEVHQAELLEDWKLAEERKQLKPIAPLEQLMIPVIEVRYVSGYKLWLVFADGCTGEVDLEAELWGQMFEPLRDVELFKQVKVNPELRTITWPNGADLAPEFLYRAVSVRV